MNIYLNKSRKNVREGNKKNSMEFPGGGGLNPENPSPEYGHATCLYRLIYKPKM